MKKRNNRMILILVLFVGLLLLTVLYRDQQKQVKGTLVYERVEYNDSLCKSK